MQAHLGRLGIALAVFGIAKSRFPDSPILGLCPTTFRLNFETDYS